MPREHIQELERVIEKLFDTAYPKNTLALHGRAMKPLIAPVLGCLVTDPDARVLQRNRDYYRIDFLDFVDYATSTLPRLSRLGDIPDNQALFYEGIDRAPSDSLFQSTYLGESGTELSILDVALARHGVFVSVTMRFRVFAKMDDLAQKPSDSSRIPEEPLYQLVTLTLAPARLATRTPDLALLELQPLEEWDRYTIYPPYSGDDEWRFTISGIYTDSLLDEMAKHTDWEGAPSRRIIDTIHQHREENYKAHATQFELARLALHLPAYCAFMYDLVVPETVQVGTRKKTVRMGARRPEKKILEEPVYRIIKSIRIIREDTYHEKTPRTWTPPAHSFAVRGHWRQYHDLNRRGHDEAGDETLGRTWVRDYVKGEEKDAHFPFPTTSVERQPNVVIKIKQPLSVARELMDQLHTVQHASEGSASAQDGPQSHRCEAKPSAEWRMRERSKLSAGLRYIILRRDGFRCRACGRSAVEENAVRLEVDHIKPVDDWGRTEESNLHTLCKNCNRGKSNRLP